jgi:predicted ATPase
LFCLRRCRGEERPRRRRPRTNDGLRVFVAGFPDDYDHAVVAERFDGVKSVVSRARHIILTFETPEAAQAAVARNGEQLDSDALRIELAYSA